MHLHNSITFWKQSEPWWCSKLKTRSFAQRRWRTACVWGQKSIWWAGDHYGETVRRVCGSLYVISMEIKQRSTERRILRRDQMQPTTKDQRESKHSLGKNTKKTCCKGRISSKIAQKRILPGLVHGFRKAVRICMKRKKNNEQSFLCEPLWRTPTDHGKSNRATCVQIVLGSFAICGRDAYGGYPQGSGPSSDGELQKSLTVSLGVQLDSYWGLITYFCNTLSMRTSPQNNTEVHQKRMPSSQGLNVHLNWPTHESCTGIIRNIRLLEE